MQCKVILLYKLFGRRMGTYKSTYIQAEVRWQFNFLS